MRVILHIGMEKTGTTSIQSFLARNDGALFNDGFGVCGKYVDPKAQNNIGFVLASSRVPGDDLLKARSGSFEDWRGRIASQISSYCDFCREKGVENIVVSSEHLSSRLMSIEEISALRSLFPSEVGFEVLVYVRRQDEVFLGTQAEGIKAGGKKLDFSDPTGKERTAQYGIAYYDIELMLLPWIEVFGEKSINLNIFESEQMLQKNVVVDFLAAIGSSLTVQGHNGYNNKHNKRLSPEMLFVLAKANAYLDDKVRPQFINMLEKMDRFESGTLIANDVLDEFYSEFSESNLRIANRFFKRDFLFSDKSLNLREAQPKKKLLDEGVVFKLLIDFFNRYLNKTGNPSA